jgi:hypothetical protein
VAPIKTTERLPQGLCWLWKHNLLPQGSVDLCGFTKKSISSMEEIEEILRNFEGNFFLRRNKEEILIS